MHKKPIVGAVALTLSLGLAGCSDSDDDPNPDTGDGGVVENLDVPETYNFESRFQAGDDSALYPGQVTRQVLIDDLNTDIAVKFGERLSGQETPDWTGGQAEKAEVLAILNNFYEEGTAAIGDEPILLTTDPVTEQETYNEISSGKNLVGKTAGNDDVTDHKDWDGGDFVGWDTSAETDSPEQLLRDWFDRLADLTVAASDRGTPRQDPVTASAELEVYHTEDGLDLKQLIQKFLLGAVTFSQGTDDYLDDDVDGKGIMTDNTEADGDGADPFTVMEHQFDEGFGYFGAARDYLAYTDEEIAGKGGRDGWSEGFHDTNDDGQIDLEGEFNFGNSQNAAKRDLGSVTGTDFTQQAMDAFLTGRTIIAEAGGVLSDDEMAALKEQRDLAVDAWEKSISATVIHYINDTISDMDDWSDDQENGTDNYSYIDHTKHFGEMKGFALGLQFNPRSPLNENNGEDFQTLHNLLRERPALPPEGQAAQDGATQADFDQYRQDLLEARSLLQDAYDFEEADVENW